MRYLRFTILFTLLLTAALYLFVLGVDPYDVYGFNLLNYPYKAVRSARVAKFNYVDSRPNRFKTFIIGSSRAERFDPERFGQCFSSLPAYNYSVENANAEDLLAIIKHVYDTQQPENIIVFIDFYMFNSYIGYDRRFMRSPLRNYLAKTPAQQNKGDGLAIPYWHASYLSLRGLYDALRLTVRKWNNDKNSPVYLSNGQHIPEKATQKPQLASAYFSHQYKDFKPDTERLEMFRQIKQLADKHHTMLRVVLTPMMPRHYRKMLASPLLADNFKRFRKELVDIFGQVIDFNNEDTARFMENRYWYDTVHPTEELANIMTDIICGKRAPVGSFGKILHRGNTH